MKRITPLSIILWSLLSIAGIAFAVFAVVFRAIGYSILAVRDSLLDR